MMTYKDILEKEKKAKEVVKGFTEEVNTYNTMLLKEKHKELYTFFKRNIGEVVNVNFKEIIDTDNDGRTSVIFFTVRTDDGIEHELGVIVSYSENAQPQEDDIEWRYGGNPEIIGKFVEAKNNYDDFEDKLDDFYRDIFISDYTERYLYI